jgi:hypothetical protein
MFRNKVIVNAIFLWLVMLALACGTPQVQFSVSTTPVYVSQGGYYNQSNQYFSSKEAFYLVKGAGKDKENIKKVLDSVAGNIVIKDSSSYVNYIVYFFNESGEVNEKSIQALDKELRYKFFENHNNDLIAYYTYRDSMFISMNWSDKYK